MGFLATYFGGSGKIMQHYQGNKKNKYISWRFVEANLTDNNFVKLVENIPLKLS